MAGRPAACAPGAAATGGQQVTVQPEDMHSRDLGTLEDDGQQLVQFETPGARDTGGQGAALAQRPQYSPVAQPGTERIHWHTVETEEPARQHERPARGMFARLHQRQGKGAGGPPQQGA
jgi:hypothetical protein